MQSAPSQQAAVVAEAKLPDPMQVVATACAPAASPLCRCIVDVTVRTLQAGPRDILALVQRPGVVWDEAIKSLDPGQRTQVENARVAAEHDCRRRIAQGGKRITTMERMVRASTRGRPKQSIRASCSAEGGSAEACACYEQTIGAALTPDDFEIVRDDARFPPVLEEMPAERRRMALAAMASARTACGVGARSS
ncbi:MAG TPA: hypothetical protein VGO52_25885 [Hyphomonadaceae bacterium]|jgi:hypothetical protein|nr:hypothetical protein [Hyphomonadaceae bacterium]